MGRELREDYFDQIIVFFFGACFPSKLVNIGAKGALRKILGSVNQNGYLKLVQRGEPFGRQGFQKSQSSDVC